MTEETLPPQKLWRRILNAVWAWILANPDMVRIGLLLLVAFVLGAVVF